jgi:hypothetical protein
MPITSTITANDPNNVDSELTPSEMGREPAQPSEPDEDKIKLVDKRFLHATDNRRMHEGIWYESLAMYQGDQFVRWQPGTAGADGKLISLANPKKPYTVRNKRNKISGKVKKLRTAALRGQPSVDVEPLTGSRMDRAAAAQARAGLGHLDRLFRRKAQTQEVAQLSLTTSTAFLKVYWDKDAEADVPVYPKEGEPGYGLDSEPIDSKRAPIGEIAEPVVPIFELYIDPQARTWADVGWLIHAKIRPLAEVQEKYKNHGGLDVAPEAGTSGAAGYVESRLANAVGEYARGSEPGGADKTVLVKEMWEKPSLRYPAGRLVTVANGVLLRDDPWPYDKKDDFPFIPLAYEKGIGTTYGRNAVADLIDPQRSYNEGISRTIEHRRTAWGKILTPEGCEIGADAFDAAMPNEVITYKPGVGKPEHIPAPDLPAVITELLRIDSADIDDISGVHDISQGVTPPGVTAGNAIQMLQEADASQLEDFITNIEEYHLKRAEWELALMVQFYKSPRLIYQSQLQKPTPIPMPPMAPQLPQQAGPVDVTPGMPRTDPAWNGTPPPAPPQAPPAAPQGDDDDITPAMAAQSFSALGQGMCRVKITSSSAVASSPAAQSQQYQDMYKLGVFGPPGSPQAAAVYLPLVGLSNGAEIVELVRQGQAEERAHEQAMQPDPATVEAAKAASQQQALAAAHEQAMTAQGIDDHNAQLKLEHDREVQAAEHQHEIDLLKAKNDFELQKLQMQHAADIELAKWKFEHPQLTAAADPTGVLDIEKEAGFEGKIPPPPVPASANGAKPKPTTKG